MNLLKKPHEMCFDEMKLQQWQDDHTRDLTAAGKSHFYDLTRTQCDDNNQRQKWRADVKLLSLSQLSRPGQTTFNQKM